MVWRADRDGDGGVVARRRAEDMDVDLVCICWPFPGEDPKATRIPVPARHVDRSAVIEVGGRGGVCVS